MEQLKQCFYGTDPVKEHFLVKLAIEPLANGIFLWFRFVFVFRLFKATETVSIAMLSK